MKAIFLMCSERSGSNLITRMFDAHPDCCGPSPSHLVRILAENRFRYGDLNDDRNWLMLLQDARDILATKLGSWREEWTTDRLDAACRERSLAVLVRTVLTAEARAAGKEHLFIKENHLYRYLPFVRRAFADLKILAMVRDPRDMALSWKRSPILRGDVVRAARIWYEDQMNLLRTMGDNGPGSGIYLLRYEDLIQDPAAWLTAACRFAGLDFDPAMTEFHRRGASARDADRTDDWKNLGRPVLNRNHRKWVTGLTGAEAAYVEAVCAEPMTALGYAPELDDPRPVRELEAVLLPLERHDKPGWADVPAAEKKLRNARAEVLRRITGRPAAASDTREPAHA